MLVAVVVLLFRGEYPRSTFDLVLGLNRWVLRVLAYAAVMTPEYPPFRIDAGEAEPGGALTVGPVAAGTAIGRRPGAAAQGAERPPTRWGAGRVAALVVASITGLLAIGLTAAGGTGIVFDQTQRNSSGYLMTPATRYSTSTYALVTASYRGGTSND